MNFDFSLKNSLLCLYLLILQCLTTVPVITYSNLKKTPCIYRKIQDLQADLSSSTQQSAKLREEKDRLRKDAEKERENLSVKHNDVVNTIKLTLQDVVSSSFHNITISYLRN